MEFINRTEELYRLDALVKEKQGGLAVLWGRRRVGKTRLLLEWSQKHGGLYTVADQSAPAIQRAYLAESISHQFSGFDEVVYPDWRVLLRRISNEAEKSAWRGPLILDEFPYLVDVDKTLPSIFQNWIDHEAKQAGMVVAIAGSSQRMMQGLMLAPSAPLYGRASVMMKLKSLQAGHLHKALNHKSYRNTVEAFAVWGGIPWYWELAAEFGDDLDRAVDSCVLDSYGVLHMEPDRLLREETPSATILRPLLDTIGAGSHRLSEIAARLEQPVTSLGRPLKRLLELGLVKREQPFGESEKSGKRTLYRISDPFFRFWFRVVASHRAFLTEAASASRIVIWKKHRQNIFAETWEDLCRQSVAFLGNIDSALAALGPWEPAKRYWRGSGPAWDLVSLSLDKRRLLLGEAKWFSENVTPETIRGVMRELFRKGVPDLKLPKGCVIIYAVFVPEYAGSATIMDNVYAISAADVIRALS